MFHATVKNVRIDLDEQGAFNMPSHEMHGTIEVYYLIEGERMYFVENQRFLVPRGAIVYVGSNRLHKTFSANNHPHVRLLLEVDPVFVREWEARFPGYSLTFLASRAFALCLPEHAEHAYAAELLARILDLARTQPGGYEQQISCSLFALLVCVQRVSGSHTPEQPLKSHKHQKIYEITQYLSSTSGEIISLDELCARFFISKYYLCHSFKDVTGTSVASFIRLVRIKRARVLFDDTKMSVSSVARQVGYDNVARFSRAFKSVVGVTPREYRRGE